MAVSILVLMIEDPESRSCFLSSASAEMGNECSDNYAKRESRVLGIVIREQASVLPTKGSWRPVHQFLIY
jgi:hypothetical protein